MYWSSKAAQTPVSPETADALCCGAGLAAAGRRTGRADCSGMTAGVIVSEEEAIAKGAQPCTICRPDGDAAALSDEAIVYTGGGKYYHKTSVCGAMQSGQPITRAQAIANGQTECPYCHPDATATPSPTATPRPTEAPTAEPTEVPTQAPTAEPTAVPTEEPTVEPTIEPTAEPTVQPTPIPTTAPGEEPTAIPTIAPAAPYS